LEEATNPEEREKILAELLKDGFFRTYFYSYFYLPFRTVVYAKSCTDADE
jgi:hypothetical protein